MHEDCRAGAGHFCSASLATPNTTWFELFDFDQGCEPQLLHAINAIVGHMNWSMPGSISIVTPSKPHSMHGSSYIWNECRSWVSQQNRARGSIVETPIFSNEFKQSQLNKHKNTLATQMVHKSQVYFPKITNIMCNWDQKWSTSRNKTKSFRMKTEGEKIVHFFNYHLRSTGGPAPRPLAMLWYAHNIG